MPEIFSAKKPVTVQTPAPDLYFPVEVADHKRHVDEYSDVMRFETPSKNPLDSFAAKPEGTFFDSQQREEQVVLLLRRHPVTQIGWLMISIGLILFPLLFSLIPVGELILPIYSFAALVLWYLIVLGYMAESFLTWFFNVFISTDERVIDVDFISLIYKTCVSYGVPDARQDKL